MNFVAATSLVHLQQHEENTFWFMVALLHSREFAKVFDFTSAGKFKTLCFQLDVLSYVYVPAVFEHFQHMNIPTDIYASNWFITLFSNDLPFDVTPAVIDVYLLEGNKGLLRIALGLLSFLQDDLLKMKSYDDLMVFMSHSSAREDIFRKIDQHSLFNKASTFKITHSLLRELERLHRLDQLLQPTDSDYNSAQAQRPDPRLMEFRTKYGRLKHFKRLQLISDEASLQSKHSWHTMQITPDQANQLHKDGFSDREIEDIWQFYNSVLKNKELSQVLNEIESAYDAISSDSAQKLCERESTKYGTATLSLVQSEKSIKEMATKQERHSPPVSARN